MQRLFLFIVLLLSSFFLNAQKRQLNRTISDIEKGEYANALEKLNELEKNEGRLPEILFVKFVYHKSKPATSDDLDSALQLLESSYYGIVNFEQKDKEKLCKEFNFCENLLPSYKEELDKLIFTYYTSNRSRSMIMDFQMKYPDNKWISQSEILIDSLDYEAIKSSENINDLKNYIKSHPNSSYNGTVQEIIYKRAYNNAREAGSMAALQSFLADYQNAPQAEAVQKLIIDDFSKRAQQESISDELENFLAKFPLSIFSAESRKKFENLMWSEAVKQNNGVAYKNFLIRFPDSELAKEARSRYEKMRTNVFPYLTREKKYRLYDLDSKEFKSDESYDQIGMMENGSFIVSKFKKTGLLDKNGNVIIPVTYNCIAPNKNLLNVQLGDKYAAYSMEGRKIIDFYYDEIKIESNLIIAKIGKIIDTAKAQYDIYNNNGVLLFSGKYHNLSVLSDSLFIANLNKRNYLINSSGKILSGKYETIYYHQDKSLIVQTGDKYGLIDTKGNVLLQPIYKDITRSDSSNYLILVNKNGQQAIADSRGLLILNFQSKNITDLNDDKFFLQANSNGSGIVPNGEIYDAKRTSYIGNQNYAWVGKFIQGYAFAGKNEKCGIIDAEGRWVVAPIYNEDLRYKQEGGIGGDGGDGIGDDYYDETIEDDSNCFYNFSTRTAQSYTYFDSYSNIACFSDGMALVQIDSLYGYVNMKGEVQIPIIYSTADNFLKGIANVSLLENGSYVQKVIDLSGKVIMNNATALYLFDQNKKVLLSSEGNFYTLELSTGRIVKLQTRPGHEYLASEYDYFISSYKGKNIILLKSGEELMDNQIDFSDYDFRQSVFNANSYFYSGNYDQALREYRSLLNQRPGSFTVNYMMARCYKEKEDSYYCKLYLNKAIDIKPDNAEARRMRMDYNYENKNWSEAIADLNILIESGLPAFDPDLYFKRAYASSETGDKNSAFSDYSALINNYPQNYAALNNRGVLYLGWTQYASALNDFNSAIKYCNSASTDDLSLYYSNKGNALFYLKRRPEACQAWKKAASYGNSSAITNLGNFCR